MFLTCSSILLLSSVHEVTAYSGGTKPLTTETNTRRKFLSLIPSVPFLATTTTILTTLSTTPPVFASSTTTYLDGPQGIKYRILKEPDDPKSLKPERAQKVKAAYTLYLKDFPDEDNGGSGSDKIDSSKGLLGEKPLEFNAGVSKVIKGWDLSILDMRVGEKRRLIIPSDLGYGDKGAGGKIPGGASLFFEVELVGMGDTPTNNAEQLKWLEDHPL